MDSCNVSRVDAHERSSGILTTTPLPYPTNVSLCYPPQPSPLSEGNQSGGSYLVSPSMTSPSNCLGMPPQQMYSNYSSPYYHSMLSSQQSYYGTILPTPGHHSSAFYGTFYNPNSPSVYPGTGQSSLNPINYYSPTLYMQNHETVWNPTTQTTQTKRPYYNSNPTVIQPCSKALPILAPSVSESLISISPISTNQKEPDFEGSRMTASESIHAPHTAEDSLAAEEHMSDPDDGERDSVSCSSCTSPCHSDEIGPISNPEILEGMTSDVLQDTSFGDHEPSKEDQFGDENLQCLLCNNIDHLLPRLDIATKLEPIVGEHISKSILLCTQCDLMLERYLSLQKEVQKLQDQIQVMYRSTNLQDKMSQSQFFYHQSSSHSECRSDTPIYPPDSYTNLNLDHSKQVESSSSEETDDVTLSSETAALEHNSGSIITSVFNQDIRLENDPAPIETTERQYTSSPASSGVQQTNLSQIKRIQESTVQSCTECGKHFSTIKLLKRHVRNHSKLEHSCRYCGQTFNSKVILNNHVLEHAEDKSYQCQSCPRQFTQRSHYLYHVKAQHGSRDFKCETCGKCFNNRTSLTVHLRIHSGQKPYACNTCGKRFSVKSNLSAHVPKCTGQLAFKCQECDKAFGSNSAYQIHIKKHRGELPLKCNVCQMGFSKRSHLMTHERIHTKEKPFQCHVCGKSFSNSGNCNSHVKTHTDERRFVCEICGKKFGRRHGLQSHLNRHAGVKPFQCTVCDKAFHDASNLINHCKTHRKQD